jgi:subtilase family serine protease
MIWRMGITMKKVLSLAGILVLWLSLISGANAQTAQIDNGLLWLNGANNSTGSWGSDAGPITNEYFASIAALDALNALAQNNAPIYQNSILWLQARSVEHTAYVAQRISVLANAGVDLTSDISGLIALGNADNGWGGYLYFTSNNYHTALALQALKKINYQDQNTISYALGYLTGTQNSDGGWGFCSSADLGCVDGEGDSNVYMTALIVETLSQFKTTYNLTTPISKGIAYILAHQNIDSGFGPSTGSGQGTSNVYETALAVIALIDAPSTGSGQVGSGFATALQNAINYLIATQSSNGSWNDDPYSTALALRALANVKPNLSVTSSDITFSNPAPTVGDTITITANIHNTGTAQAGTVLVQFYDGNPTSGGTLIGETTVSNISAFGSAPASIIWTIPAASTKVIFISIDPLNVIGELNETDNTASKNLTSATLPDLSITSADIVVFPPSPDPYIMVSVSGTVRNLGETAAANVKVDLYLGDPAVGGMKFATQTIVSIPAGGVGNVFGVIPPEYITGGNKTVYLLVDPQNTISEMSKANNQAIKTFLISDGYIDLTVTSTGITFTPVNPKDGNTVTISAVISNSGGGYAYATNVVVRFYLGDPASGGTKIGSDVIVPSLGSATVSTTWNTTGHAGNNNIYVVVDPDDIIAETNELNNKAFKTTKVASSQGPDLTLVSSDISFSPLTPQEGDTVIISAKIRNSGNQDASNVPVEFSLGDPTVGGTLILGTSTIPFIAKGGFVTAQLFWNTTGFAGTYEVYANTDPANQIIELDEINNMAHATLVVKELQGPDITVTLLDTTTMTTDTQTLSVLGALKATIRNKGNQPINTPFDITAFEDSNNNKLLDTGTDNILGKITYTDSLAAGASVIVTIPVTGNILFRDNLIYVMADSGNAIQEMDKTNNMRNTGQQCEFIPPVGTFNPVEKWRWTGSTVMPTHNQVMHTPAVARIVDTNGDGVIDDKDVPAIIVNTFHSDGSYASNGVLRALRGDTGQEIFTVTDPAYRTIPSAGIAVGDIDGDGLVEIVAVKNGGGIIVFNNDGSFKWSNSFNGFASSYYQWGGPSLADIDNDGVPEIVIGATVFNADGTLRWTGSGGKGGTSLGPLSLVADIDNDGVPEIIAGNTVYRNNGSILWQNTSIPDGFNAVANFNDDPYPEIVLVSEGKIYLIDHTGQKKWGPIVIPGGVAGGPPTIADFDGDGKLEIGVAGASRYVVFRSDGTVLWQSVISDVSSNVTGSSVFDFDGDGKAEVVYSDEYFFRIYRGRDGFVLFETPNSTHTTYEYPIVADVDNNDRAEIVVVSNNYGGVGGNHGVRVFEDANNTWVNTRKIWNQHSYHITNVNDDGTIPRHEENSWEKYNTYRCNSLLPDQALATPDISASNIVVDRTALSLRIGNGGALAAAGGVDVAFYDGDPQAGGVILGTATTTKTIKPGEYQDVSVTLSNPTTNSWAIFAVADKDGKLRECRKDNNIAKLAAMADLEITSSDISITPSDLKEGQPAVITVTAHNKGGLAAANVVISVYDGDPKSGGVLIGSSTQATIAAGSSAIGTVQWNTSGQSGRNYLYIVADLEGRVLEIDKTNNSVIVPVDVSVLSKPDLQIRSSDITVAAINPQVGDMITVTSVVHNIGTATGPTDISLYDGDPKAGGHLVASKTISEIIPSQGQSTVIFTITTPTPAGSHSLYVVVDPENKIDEINETNNTAWNTLTIGPGFSIAITTDKAAYRANEDVIMSVNVTNLSGYAKTIDTRVLIEDSTGALVKEVATLSNLNLIPSFTVKPVATVTAFQTITLSGAKPAGTLIEINGTEAAPLDGSTTWQYGLTLQPGSNILSIVARNTYGYNSEPVTVNVTYLIPTALWQMDGNWNDSSGNGKNGTAYNGATFSTDAKAGAHSGVFDGVNDYVRIPNMAQMTAGTIEFWFNPAVNITTANTNEVTLIESDISGDVSGHFEISFNNADSMLYGAGKLVFYYNGNTTAGRSSYGAVTSNTNSWTAGTWYHLACVVDGSTWKIYVNGALENSVSVNSKLFSGNYVHIASQQNKGVGAYYNGRLDEVGIFNRALSAAEIKGLYDSASIDSQAVDPVAQISQTINNLIWNTGSTYAGDYRAHLIIYENQKQAGEVSAGFTILPTKSADSKVATDKIAYRANEQITITSQLQSTSPNYSFLNLSATISITKPDGQGIFTDTKTIPTLLPGQLTELKIYWNTGVNPPGTYTVKLEVKDATGYVLSSAVTTLTISGDIKPSKLLKGTISVDAQHILQGAPVTITYNVTNAGNMDLPDINLSVLTVHVVNQNIYDTLPDHASLNMGQAYNNSKVLQTTAYTAKDYLVVLRANIAGTEETLAGTYFRVEGAPSAPSLYLPAEASDVQSLTPLLKVNNASDPNDDKLTYQFELFADSGLVTLVSSAGIAEGNGMTTWPVPLSLTENSTYYWRARAFDGRLYGEWMAPASFRVNVENDPPTAPTLSAPADNISVATITPMLSVNNAYDPDSSSLTYNFEVSQDLNFTNIITSTIGVFEGIGTTLWQVNVPLQENTRYYWRAQADDWLATGPWMTPAGFFVNTANDAPTAPVITSPAGGSEVSSQNTAIVVANSTDPDSTVLTYLFEVDTVATFDSQDLILSGNIPEGQGTTQFSATGLRDNTLYCSRAKASDGLAESPWSAVSCFFVNTTNDAPTIPVLANPSNGSGVKVLNPVLSVHNSTDLDKDHLTYDFEVYGDASLSSLVARVTGISETTDVTSWTVQVNLIENRTYYWRARAYDGQAYSPWMPVASFMVNTANDAPGAPSLNAPSNGVSLATLSPTLAVNNAIDPDSDSLTYDFEIYSNGTLLRTITGTPQNISGVTSVTMSPALSDNTAYTWRARAYDGDRYGAWMDMATFSTHLSSTNITATIDFDPDTLNKKSAGNWVTVYIELPSGYNVSNIDISSLRLEGTIPAELWPYAIGDYDSDGIKDLMVKFKRSDVINKLPNGENVKVHVSGKVGTTTFDGVDKIRVIK